MQYVGPHLCNMETIKLSMTNELILIRELWHVYTMGYLEKDKILVCCNLCLATWTGVYEANKSEKEGTNNRYSSSSVTNWETKQENDNDKSLVQYYKTDINTEGKRRNWVDY